MTGAFDDAVTRLVAAGVPAHVAPEAWSAVTEALDGTVDVAAILLGGSFAAGLANRFSDIDFLVVAREQPETPVVMSRDLDGYPVEIVGMTADEVTEVLSRFERPWLSLDALKQRTGPLMTGARALADLLDGVVLQGEEWVAEVRAALPADVARTAIAGALTIHLAARLRDAGGAMATGDVRTAAESGAMSLELASECLLARRGDIYLSRKFIPARLVRADRAIAELVSRAKRGLTHVDPRPGDVTYALRLAGDLAASALWDWELAGAGAVRGPGPRRSPYHCVVGYDGGVLVSGASDRAMTRAMAETWLAHDGSTPAEMTRRLAHRWGRDEATIGPYVRTVSEQLAAAGLLGEPDGASGALSP